MRILSNVAISGNLNLGSSNKKDTFVIGTPDLDNGNVNTDIFTVWANADFKNNVQLGANSDDLITVSGTLSASNGSIHTLSSSILSSSNLYLDEFLLSANTLQTGYLEVLQNIIIASGSNKPVGTAILNGGNPASVVVTNSLASTSSVIFLTKQTNNHSGQGNLTITKNGGSFTIYSDHNSDTDVVGYMIVNN